MYKLRERKPITDVIKRIICQDAAGELDANRLRNGIEKVFDAAATGDLDAITFIRDTVQGKPAQSVSIDSEDGAVQFTSIQMLVVKHEPVPKSLNSLDNVTIEHKL